jgi:3-oxoadipate enol-lactonase/4-carboxymuconolactone decarboxylase
VSFATIDGHRVYFRLEGADDRPVLVLSHSLGVDLGMWSPQMPGLLAHFRVLRYDLRGHGASDVPAGDYSIERLGLDVVGLVRELGIGKFAFCGLSLGGMIGQWLATHAPDSLTHLVLANTSAKMDSALMETRRRTVSESGMAAVADMVMGRFFSPATLERREHLAASVRRILLSTNPAGYAGCCAAIRDMDQVAALRAIAVPALIIVGDNDVSTPWDGHGEVLAREIPHAKAVRLKTAHLSNLERPRSFTAALLNFLLPELDPDPLQSGFTMRRRMLGDAHVDRVIAATTEFTAGFQDFITRYAWGTIWTRPGLDPRTRRLLVLVITAALGRWDEFRLHVRTGLAGELEPCDLQEALLQTAVYAGVPVSNTAFKIAAEEIQSSVGEG